MISRIVTNIFALYGPSGPGRLVGLYRKSGGPWRYLVNFWTTQKFDQLPRDLDKRYKPLRILLGLGILTQYLYGIAFAMQGIDGDYVSSTLIGAGISLVAPIIWANLLFAMALGWRLMQPKRYGKAMLAGMMEKQVKALRERNDITVIAVAGSVGKTSTKLAIAKTLEKAGKRVRYQVGNYNDRLTVPLVFFGEEEPGIYNLPAWLRILRRNQKALRQDYSADVVVVELGIDGPGQMEEFTYLHPELSVVTAVSEEHMAYFGNLETVAREELKVFDFSSQLLINTDDIGKQYLTRDSYASYGLLKADYTAELVGSASISGQKLNLKLRGDKILVTTQLIGTQGAKSVLAAAAVGHMLEIASAELTNALAALTPFSGRMQLLPGIKDSMLIDDTYNASPVAVKAALDVLYAMKAPQRIAILGSMNEMGELSPSLHEAVGEYCDPKKLDLVVTVGSDAKQYLVPHAKKAGCTVKSFTNPHKAGAFVKSEIQKRAVVLAKGSQNGVFAEEALKPLLNNADDQKKLVRQSAYWLKVKRLQFRD